MSSLLFVTFMNQMDKLNQTYIGIPDALHAHTDVKLHLHVSFKVACSFYALQHLEPTKCSLRI